MVQYQATRNFDGSIVNADAYHNSFKHSALWKQARAVLNARERLTLSDGNHLPHYFFGVECTADDETFDVTIARYEALHAEAIVIDAEENRYADMVSAMYAAQDDAQDDAVENVDADIDAMLYQHKHDMKAARRARRSNADRRDRKEEHARWLFDRLPLSVQTHELDRKRYVRIIEKSNRRPARAYQATGSYLRSE